MSRINDMFRTLARKTSAIVGMPWTFLIAVVVVIFWLLSGPFFRFSDSWQLIINTSTTIITFLMVFLIQNTQNRESKAIQLKLDELIRAIRGARNSIIDIEENTDEEIEKIKYELRVLGGSRFVSGDHVKHRHPVDWVEVPTNGNGQGKQRPSTR